MVAINVLVESFVSVISVYAPQPGLDESQKDDVATSSRQGSCCHRRRHQFLR